LQNPGLKMAASMYELWMPKIVWHCLMMPYIPSFKYQLNLYIRLNCCSQKFVWYFCAQCVLYCIRNKFVKMFSSIKYLIILNSADQLNVCPTILSFKW
jgi:hypothetical protein